MFLERIRGDDDDVRKEVHILERSREPLRRNQRTQAERKKNECACRTHGRSGTRTHGLECIWFLSRVSA